MKSHKILHKAREGWNPIVSGDIPCEEIPRFDTSFDRCRYLLLIYLFFVLPVYPVLSQEKPVPSDAIPAYFARQAELFPQEKIYVQTDKPNYLCGDTVWFKAYLVDAAAHTPTAASNFIYADLISPREGLIRRVKVAKDKGIFNGWMILPEDLHAGDYRLCFYTRYMHDEQADYLFDKRIAVNNYFSTRYRVEATFTTSPKKGILTAGLSFKELDRKEVTKPEKVQFFDKNGKLLSVEPDNNGHYRFDVKEEDREKGFLSMQYTFGNRIQKQYIYISPPQKDYTVGFFPEGGHLPANVITRIAFKALNSDGLGEDIEGVVVSNEGDTVTSFRSSHLGMGEFNLDCRRQHTYKAVCRTQSGLTKEFPLPEVEPEAISLYTNRIKDELLVSLRKDPALPDNRSLYLTLHCRGNVIFSREWKGDLLRFPSESIPTGVLQLLLTDENNLPLSQRLVFNINKQEKTTVSFKLNKKSYGQREEVKATVGVFDDKRQRLPALLSLSVTDNGAVQKDTANNILSTLLLTSDLKGHIESPADYFNGYDNRKQRNLDLLMLTQGWTRYDITQVLKDSLYIPRTQPEISQSISGSVYRGLSLNKPAEAFPVTLLAPLSAMSLKAETDAEGRFVFHEMLFADSTVFVVQGNTPSGRRDVKLTIDNDSLPVAANILPFAKRNPRMEWKKEEIERKARVLDHSDITRTIQIDEVKVTASYIRKRDPELERRRSPLASEHNKRVAGEELLEQHHPVNIMDMLMYVTGVSIFRNGIEVYPYITNKNTPAYILVDNMPTTATELYATLPIFVAEIEVVKGARAATLGPKGAGGAILITTSMTPVNLKDYDEQNIQIVSPLGYQVTKEFYSPSYETKEKRNDKALVDNRTTVYWNPDIRTSVDEEGKLHFYTTDLNTAYNVVVEGLTADGRLVHWEGAISVK